MADDGTQHGSRQPPLTAQPGHALLTTCLLLLLTLGFPPGARGEAAAAVDDAPGALPPPAAREVDFVKNVQPILAAACHGCHGPAKQKADLRLDAKRLAFRGGESGPAIVPGDSANSRLIRLVAGLDPKLKMPAEGEPLSAGQVG